MNQEMQELRSRMISASVDATLCCLISGGLDEWESAIENGSYIIIDFPVPSEEKKDVINAYADQINNLTGETLSNVISRTVLHCFLRGLIELLKELGVTNNATARSKAAASLLEAHEACKQICKLQDEMQKEDA